jgi:hypothetical protein
MSNTTHPEEQDNDSPAPEIGAGLGAAPSGALGRDHDRRVRRRVIMRMVVAGGVAAAVAWAVLGVAFQNAPSEPPGAAADTIRGALPAVAPGPGQILHVVLTATETSGTGARTSWSEDAWLGYPFGPPDFFHGVAGFRQILHHSGISVQTGVFGRRPYLGTEYYTFPGAELYDASTNTIYQLPPVRDTIFCSKRLLHPTTCLPFRAPRGAGCRETDAGGFIAGVPDAFVGSTEARDRRFKAEALVDSVYFGGPSAKPFFSGLNSVIPDVWAPCVSEQLAIQIHHGLVRRVGILGFEGRRVIEFSATDGAWTYFEDAHSHKPVRLVVRGINGTEWPATPPPKREQATLTFNVRTYEQLPFAGNENLLSLTAQHPGVRIDTKAADYYAAQARLFPPRKWG